MAEIVLALDLPDPDAALRLVDRIPDLRWVKVGPVLWPAAGAPFVQRLGGRGIRVFLDLKWHDIPNTVAGAVAGACESGAAMATVHTLGGHEMLEAAAQAAGDRLALVGVTVLTSHDAKSYAHALGRRAVDLGREVERLARLARAAGLRGVVSSAREAARAQRVFGGTGIVVVPGIRRDSDRAGDQARVSTPGDALRQGATHLVVGRPILEAADPAAAYRDLCREAACGSA